MFSYPKVQKLLISDRVRSGLESARMNGRIGGRPKALIAEKAMLLKSLKQANHMSVKQICQYVGISRSVYYRALKLLEIP